MLVAGAPKLAAFAITIRLLVEGMSGVAQDWQQMLILLSVASMALGNFAAIAQNNLKRMLAYSTIGQIGFMLLGLTPTVVSVNTLSAANGYSSSLFYILTYVFTTLGTFGIVMLLSRQGFESEQIDDLKGLAKRSPWYAAVMAIFMFSLAGIPPTVGFYAKLAVLQAIVSTNQTSYIVLAVVAVLLSLVAAYYYPAPDQGDVLRRAGRPAPDREHRRGPNIAVAERRRRAGVRPAARRPDGAVRAGHRQGADHLTWTRPIPTRTARRHRRLGRGVPRPPARGQARRRPSAGRLAGDTRVHRAPRRRDGRADPRRRRLVMERHGATRLARVMLEFPAGKLERGEAPFTLPCAS